MNTIIFLFLNFALITSVRAQSVKDSLIFRKPLLFEKFIDGSVLMKSGVIENAPLNYNTDNQTIVFMKGGQYLTLMGTEMIDTIYMDNKKFVPVKDNFYEVLTSGNVSLFLTYYNRTHPVTATVTHDGNSRKDDRQVSNTISDVYVSRSFKGNYEVEFFRVYWLKKGAKLYKFHNKSQFVKPFSSQMKVAIEQYVKTNHVDFSKGNDLIELVNFCNNKDFD